MTAKISKDQPQDKSLANKVIELIINDCELVHNRQKEPFAIICKNGIRQVYNVKSKSFSDWIASTYYASKKSALSDASLKTTISTLSGKAVFGGRMVDIHTRIAATEDGYWLDLCNDKWEAVLVNKNGWSIVSGKTVPLFSRSNSMQAIPMPLKGGSIDGLWDLVNVPKHDRLIVIAWLLECLRADTPHVVLELVGEQGSAKSTSQRLFKMLIDPNVANLRAAPKKVEDVWIGAVNSHLVSFENISYLGQDYQDALCVLATGGAHATRTLYTNKEEAIIELRKPIILNGITVNITAQDLLDRSVHLELPPVEKRLQSKNVDDAFAKIYPALVGALLDQFVAALKLLETVNIPDQDKPRMLDFAYLGEAVFLANGFGTGEFLSRYKSMRQKGVYRTMESSPVGFALLNYLQSNPSGWSGQLINLLALLNVYRPAGETNWPKSAKAMGDALRRLSPALRTVGFECKSSQKQAGTITWSIASAINKVSLPSPASPASPNGLINPQEMPVNPDGDSGHAGHAGHEFRDFDYDQTEEPLPF